MERQAKIVDDPIIAEYVNRVGQNLVRNSDAKVPFTIKVLDSEEVNAFALPGGFFFVNSGLILKADSESELAGVMAHEIAHVAARHGTRQATRGELAQIAMIPRDGHDRRLDRIRHPSGRAAWRSPWGSWLSPAAWSAKRIISGLQYMYKAGYDPTSFVDFFEKIQTMEKRKPGTVAKVFSTHPMTDDRIKASQDEIQTDPEGQARVRRQHVGIQRCEGAPVLAAQSPEGEGQGRSESPDLAAQSGQRHRSGRRQR